MKNKTIWNITIAAGLIFLALALGFFILEFSGATNFCKSQDGDYSFNLKSFSHLCNGDKILKYNSILEGSYWDFERNRNIPKVSLP